MTETTERYEVATRDEVPLSFTPDKIELLKRTICEGSTDDELEMFLYVAGKTGLDPFMRQIHAVKRWDSKAQREVMSIQTGIDGYRLLADRTGRYAGNEEPAYAEGTGKNPISATVTVYKIVAGQRCPFTATARWDEYKQTKKDGSPTFMWAKMPHLMLSKCAEALALRKAFPAELSGIYTNTEMMQADVVEATVIDVTETGKAPEKEPDKPTNGNHWIMDTGRRKKFWAWTHDKTLSHEQVHEALGVDSLKEYEGTPEEAIAEIDSFRNEMIS